MVALFLFTAGCGVDLSTPPVASSDPADLAGTWVGTIEENDGVVYETTAVFSANGDISFTIHRDPDAPDTTTGTVGSLDGSDKIFSFTLDGTNEGGLVADDTFAHAGIIVQGFSAGVLQKTTDPDNDKTSKFSYSLIDIGSADSSITWSGSIMRVVIDEFDVITSVIGKTSTVTISSDGSFSGNNFDDQVIQSTTTPDGNFGVTDVLGRYTGIWELTDQSQTGPVVILITPDKTFLGSYSCVGTIRALDTCDFHLWHQ
ncbi:MAG: hypothetical protein IIC64_12815 [SAR324 cluster bacterium]|nr:hypothetical protein [SAR324 cluster bacterium]